MSDHDKLFDSQEEILFYQEAREEQKALYHPEPWRILVVDDEEEIHHVTRMVLGNFRFEGRPVEFHSAFNSKEAKAKLQEIPQFALVLLDVVMESEQSGLEVVRFIREELHNFTIRIILRTGQPGKAPEKSVIMDYDINDYKEKTELTSQKLFTTVTTALRSYRDIMTIERSKQGLEQIIKSSATIFELQSLHLFAQGILMQLLSIIGLNESSIYVKANGFTASADADEFVVLAATGDYKDWLNRNLDEVMEPRVRELFLKALATGNSFFDRDEYVGFFTSKSGARTLLYLRGCENLSPLDKHFIQIFTSNVTIAFENLYLNKEIVDTQTEIISTLGEIVENRHEGTAMHVNRVGEYCRLFAEKLGMSAEDIELLRLAAPMHDIGKIGIPDSILFKPDKLTKEEFEQIKKHSSIGHGILKKSNRRLMQAAAIVAYQHHEHWDGKGYPNGLKGEEIHIYGRIAGIADVFDALFQKRAYKASWSLENIVDYIKNQKGKQFDPQLVDILMDNLDDFIEIMENAEYLP